jgi:hypothetical protein
VGRCRKAERHHVLASTGYFGLALRIGHHLHVSAMVHCRVIHILGMKASCESRDNDCCDGSFEHDISPMLMLG